MIKISKRLEKRIYNKIHPLVRLIRCSKMYLIKHLRLTEVTRIEQPTICYQDLAGQCHSSIFVVLWMSVNGGRFLDSFPSFSGWVMRREVFTRVNFSTIEEEPFPTKTKKFLCSLISLCIFTSLRKRTMRIKKKPSKILEIVMLHVSLSSSNVYSSVTW